MDAAQIETAIADAHRAERGLARIARTRRPTEAESAVALAAYARAAEAQQFLKPCRDCDQRGFHAEGCPERRPEMVERDR